VQYITTINQNTLNDKLFINVQVGQNFHTLKNFFRYFDAQTIIKRSIL